MDRRASVMLLLLPIRALYGALSDVGAMLVPATVIEVVLTVVTKPMEDVIDSDVLLCGSVVLEKGNRNDRTSSVPSKDKSVFLCR